MRRVVVEVAVWWLVTLGLWCAFVSTLSSTEILSGAAAGLVAALSVAQLRVIDWPVFRPTPRWVSWLPAFIASAVGDTIGVFLALWRWVVRGERDGAEFRTIPLGPPGDDRRSRAHRALAAITLSATPGAYVVQTYPEHGEARVHVFGTLGADLAKKVGR
jgi:multisubunit Na+/H+ antiporter MnhE subunit